MVQHKRKTGRVPSREELRPKKSDMLPLLLQPLNPATRQRLLVGYTPNCNPYRITHQGFASRVVLGASFVFVRVVLIEQACRLVSVLSSHDPIPLIHDIRTRIYTRSRAIRIETWSLRYSRSIFPRNPRPGSLNFSNVEQ